MKDSTENSWCYEVKRILEIYDLPSAYELFVNPPSKNEWKSILNSKLKLRGKRTFVINHL